MSSSPRPTRRRRLQAPQSTPAYLSSAVALLALVAVAFSRASPRFPHPPATRRCRPDAEGSWSAGVFLGDSPFNLKPIEHWGISRDAGAAWPVANPAVTCADVAGPGFPSSFVANPFLFLQGRSYRVCRVVINAWAIGRDPATWERAEEFQPERFLDSAVDFRGQDFELIPFGAGRRGCPGVGFAMPTLEMALASLLYHFDWAPAGRPGISLDMSEVNGLVVRLKGGLQLVAKPRLP